MSAGEVVSEIHRALEPIISEFQDMKKVSRDMERLGFDPEIKADMIEYFLLRCYRRVDDQLKIYKNSLFGGKFRDKLISLEGIEDPDNEYDREAIRAEVKGLGKIGYVANSPHTVLGESMSAGRLYDKIGDTAAAVILYNMGNALQCRLTED